jgi:hypothetical protein
MMPFFVIAAAERPGRSGYGGLPVALPQEQKFPNSADGLHNHGTGGNLATAPSGANIVRR